MQHKVIKTGNSLAVTIPSEFSQSIGLKPGDEVSVSVDLSKAVLTYTFSNSSQLPLLSGNN